MASSGFAITGVKELEKAFAELGKANTAAVLRSALIKAAKPTVMAGSALGSHGEPAEPQDRWWLKLQSSAGRAP